MKNQPFLSWKTWAVYAVLALLGIPWYWNPNQDAIFLGMPVWALTSLGAGFLSSLYTAWLLVRFWPLEDEEDPS